jgi:dihydrofolate synthase/folylpolyglutamate synthase
MSYPGAIKFLYELQLFGAKLGLENTFRLAELCGNPQQSLRFIHVAGTNGKGSTCAMLESIYRAGGLRVGLFTSPHLISFRERIQVNRQPISEQQVVEQVRAMKELLENFPKEQHPTFFEVVTVMALRYFAAEGCDLVIWETGLGGRLDATNIVRPLASVITNVQLDHEKWLGATVERIAAEKAGIIKLRVPVFTSAEDPTARAVIAAAATREEAPLFVIAKPLEGIALPLLGEHQRLNAALAKATVRYLADQIPVSDEAIRRGLETVSWPGRLQVIKRGRQTILLDGAHNPAGAKALRTAITQNFANEPPTLIFGIMRDKDYVAMCDILAPVATRIVTCPVASDRTADAQQLARQCEVANPKAIVTAATSLESALQQTRTDEFVVVTGSLHFIGHALQLLCPTDYPDERALNEYTLTPR